MMIGWGFLLPTGVIMAHFAKHYENAFWFKYHRANQIIGLCIAFAGWVIALHSFDVFSAGTSNVSYIHGTLGIIIMIIGILQPINAFLRPHYKPPLPKHWLRKYWEYLHKGCGFTALFLAIIQIAIGISLVSKPRDMLGFQIGYGCIWAIMITLVVFLIYDKKSHTPVELDAKK